MGGLSGRRALVTGGGSGIGRACAAALAAAGAEVTVLGRREAPLRAVVEAGEAAHLLVADISALPALPPQDILVNAAGIAPSAPFLKSDPAMWEEVLRINLLGAVAVTRTLLPGMLAAGWGGWCTLLPPRRCVAIPMCRPMSPRSTPCLGWCGRWRWKWPEAV